MRILQPIFGRLYPMMVWGALLGMVAHSAIRMNMLPTEASVEAGYESQAGTLDDGAQAPDVSSPAMP